MVQRTQRRAVLRKFSKLRMIRFALAKIRIRYSFRSAPLRSGLTQIRASQIDPAQVGSKEMARSSRALLRLASLRIAR